MNNPEKIDPVIHAIQKMKLWRTALFALIIFFAGLVIGISVTLISIPPKFETSPPPEIAAERMVTNLEHHLHLSPQQIDKIKPVLKKYLEKLHQVRMDVRPQIIEQIQMMDQEISSLLDEHQKQIWKLHFQRMQGDLSQRPQMTGPRGPRGPANRQRFQNQRLQRLDMDRP